MEGAGFLAPPPLLPSPPSFCLLRLLLLLLHFISLGGQGVLLQSHMKSVNGSVSFTLFMNTSRNSDEKSAISVLGLLGGDLGERQGEVCFDTSVEVIGETLAEDLQLVSFCASFSMLM